MAKVYTLDKKLITGDKPEIRIGDKIYGLDDRKKTVVKVLEVIKNKTSDDTAKFSKIAPLVFGDKSKEVEKIVDELSWAAFQELFALVMSAVLGEDIKKDEDNKKEDNASSGS